MPPVAAPAQILLGRRQLYLLPTRYGLLFALLLLVQLLAAINYGNGLAYALTFLLGSAAVVSMLYTQRNLLHLRLAVRCVSPVFAGETARLQIHLFNDSAVPRYGVCVMHDKTEIGCVDIPAHGHATVELGVRTAVRGWLAAPLVTLTTRFPLGLLYAWSRRVALDPACLVYPRPAGPVPFRATPPPCFEPAPGNHAGGEDFIGLREFRTGDSPRQVDWKAVARGSTWRVKQFGGGCQATIWLDWEGLGADDVEKRLSVLTYGVLEAEQQGMVYGLRLPQTTLPPANGEAHRRACLRALALFGIAT
jgi:uncharacterized protein (DUF58 family)